MHQPFQTVPKKPNPSRLEGFCVEFNKTLMLQHYLLLSHPQKILKNWTILQNLFSLKPVLVAVLHLHWTSTVLKQYMESVDGEKCILAG